MRRFFWCFLILAGCTAPPRVGKENGTTPTPIPAHPWRMMIVYVPQTDDAAAGWLKWFVKDPNLRMVIALSPRFTHVAKDPLRSQLLALKKAGRLEMALQIPNAPILPLIVEDPPYGFPDDVIQLIAQAKAGFFKTWGFLPQGLVLPYGASSPKLNSFLERLGFSWIVEALGLAAVDGPYQSGSLAVWDGSQTGKLMGTAIHVWDEREMKGRAPLDGWMMELKAKSGAYLLPHDANVLPVALGPKDIVKLRTWSEMDGSTWIGLPAKNAAWSALRRTRDVLEKYKNSGQASVQRLDVAFDEIYTAQNSNYFAAIGNPTLSPALVEEREHEFQATLLTVYRVIAQPPPEDLFASSASASPVSPHLSSTTVRAESLADGKEHVTIEDATGDALVPGGGDLKSLQVWTSSDSVQWAITLSSGAASSVDIYIDLNGQPNVGTPSFLSGRPYGASPSDAWEYALSISGSSATLYRTEGAGTYGTVQTYPVVMEGSTSRVTIPRDMMRGNPRRWGYQILVMSGSTLSDFIDPLEISQKELLQDLSAGKRNDIPFIRVRNK